MQGKWLNTEFSCQYEFENVFSFITLSYVLGLEARDKGVSTQSKALYTST